MRTIKKYLKYIGNIVTVLSIVLVIYALFKLDIDYSKLANPASILVCIAGALGVTLTVYILAYTWKNTLDYLANTKTKYSEVAHVSAARKPVLPRAGAGTFCLRSGRGSASS